MDELLAERFLAAKPPEPDRSVPWWVIRDRQAVLADLDTVRDPVTHRAPRTEG